MSKLPPRQHYISQALMKRWAEDGKVGVVCLHHRRIATGPMKGLKGLHWVHDLSSDAQETEWGRAENRASYITGELLERLGSDLSDLDAARRFLCNPSNSRALVEFAVLHHSRSLTASLQQLFDGGPKPDSAATEALIQARQGKAQNYYECGIVLGVMPESTPAPLGAVPVFHTADWGDEQIGTSARFLMPLAPRVFIAGNPHMQPGEVKVGAENPGSFRLLMWQVSGQRRNFTTPYLICQPSALAGIATEALTTTVGGALHWLALDHRVGHPDNIAGEHQQTEWRRRLQRHRENQLNLATKALRESTRNRIHDTMKTHGGAMQNELDALGTPICNCSQLYHKEAPEVRAVWGRYMPRVICEAMNGRLPEWVLH